MPSSALLWGLCVARGPPRDPGVIHVGLRGSPAPGTVPLPFPVDPEQCVFIRGPISMWVLMAEWLLPGTEMLPASL